MSAPRADRGLHRRTGATTLEVRDLRVAFGEGADSFEAVKGISFDIAGGEIVGLVGESGSGKSVTSLAVAGLTEHTGGRVVGGQALVNGTDVLRLSRKKRSAVLGRDIGMIFQQPTRSLNPTMRVGEQIAESVRRHLGLNRSDAWARSVEMLDKVRIKEPARRARDYPHTFSGGMCQRVMIAMAMACEPSLLVADEPTTALDVTVQKRVLELMGELQEDSGVAILLITHDLGVVAQVCTRVNVMYLGDLVEQGPTQQVLSDPRDAYTRRLLAAVPRRVVPTA